MEMEDILNHWKTYDAKLDQSLHLNKNILRAIKTDKAKSSMQRLMIARSIEAAIFGFFMVALWIFMFNRLANPEFIIAAGVLLVFCIIGFAGSLKQIVLISQIDYADSVVGIQKKIEQITAHNLQLTRLSMLSLPFYTAYIMIGFELFFGVNLYTQGNPHWWIGQFIFSIAMIPLTIWLYRKISSRNMHLKWVRSFTNGLGGAALTKSLQFLKEVEAFEKQ